MTSSTAATARVFKLPDLGEGLTEAEIVKWLIGVDDEVAVDQSIVEVETAKSIVEIPSPYAGRVAILHGAVGETVDVGSPLVTIEALVSTPSAEQPAASPPVASRQEEQVTSGNVLIGYGTVGRTGSRRGRRPRFVASACGTGRCAESSTTFSSGAPPRTALGRFSPGTPPRPRWRGGFGRHRAHGKERGHHSR